MNNRYREEEKELDKQEQNQDIESEVVESVDEDNSDELAKDKKIDLEEEVKRLNNLYLRTLADTENFKKRINDERLKERKYASQGLLEKLVNAIDIFDKAVSYKPDDEKLKNFLIGFEMINNNLKQILEEEGVKKMNTIGQKFDPLYHHAVETDCVEEEDDEIILSETQSGYIYKDRVLRPAMVKVNKKNIKMEEK